MARKAIYKTVETHRLISISYLKKHGLLNPGKCTLSWIRNGEPFGGVELLVSRQSIQVDYCWQSRRGANWSPVSNIIELTNTPVFFGGNRLWFLCPDCRRRCGVLYIDGPGVGCRECLDLRYASQREQKLDRAVRRRGKYEEQLGFRLRDNKIKLKPKGMHWSTYESLLKKARSADWQALDELQQRLGTLCY